MKKQTVIVTGVSSAIGKEIARYFLVKGDNVVINSLTSDRLTEVFRELGGGENLAMVAGDVSDRITGIKLLATAVGMFGSADVLVNNTGVFEIRLFLDMDEAYLGQFFDINLKGIFFTTQAIIPQMLKQRNGVVINVGTPLVNNVLEGAAAEFGKYNIRFNTIAPSMIRPSVQGSRVDRNGGLYLFNGVGEAEDIAQMVYTVAKSKFITGAVINVDGA